MSCESNSNKASFSATVSGGISKIQSKAAAVSTAAANRILDTIDRGGVVDKIASNPLVRAQRALTYETVRDVQGAVALGLAVASAGAAPVATVGVVAASTGAALYKFRLNADKSNGPAEEVEIPSMLLTQKLGGPKTFSIPVWPQKGDPSTMVFTTPRRTNWQKSVTEQGDQKITTLKARQMDAPEFYFKGELSNADAVKIASGRMKPGDIQKLPGYLGRIETIEKLNPNWVMAKRVMILQSAGGNNGTPTHKIINAALIGPRASAALADSVKVGGHKMASKVKGATTAVREQVKVRQERMNKWLDETETRMDIEDALAEQPDEQGVQALVKKYGRDTVVQAARESKQYMTVYDDDHPSRQFYDYLTKVENL